LFRERFQDPLTLFALTGKFPGAELKNFVMKKHVFKKTPL